MSRSQFRGKLRLSLLALLITVQWSCAASPKQKAARFMERGKQFMSQKDYLRANLEFRNAIKALPNEAEGYYQAGLAGLAAGSIREAAGAFRRATELNPKHVDAQVKFAGMLAASRDKDLVADAGTRLKQALVIAPDNAEAVDTLAYSEMLAGNVDEAARLLESLLAKSPAALRSSITLAKLKVSQNDFPGAEEVLKQAVETSPKSADALAYLGWFHVSRRKLNMAESEFQRALAIDPRNLNGLLGRGLLQVSAKPTEEAEETLKKLSTHSDKSYEAVYGAFLFHNGKREEALAEFRRLAARNPEDRIARQRLYNIYTAMGRSADAGNLVEEALRRNPKDADALVLRSEIHARTGQIREAEADARKALGFMPTSAAAHLALAKVLRLQGLGLTERQELSQALKLNPELLPARVALAKSLTAGNDSKAALALLDEAPRAQSETLGVIVARNWAYLGSGNAKAARVLIDRVLKREKVPEVVLQDGYARFAEKDYEGAMTSAGELLLTQPDNASAARLIADAGKAGDNIPEAIKRVRALVTRRNESATLRILLGDLLLSSGDPKEARKEFEAAKAIAPESAEPDIALSKLDFKEKRFDNVRRRLTVLTAADKRNSRALLLLAHAENGAGNRDEAMKGYKAVLEFEPANLIALNNLAYLTAYRNPDEALNIAQKAVEISPDSPGLHDTLGWIYYRKASYKRAVEYLEMAAKKDPIPIYEYHLGKAYMKVADPRGAEMISAALQKDPNLAKSERVW